MIKRALATGATILILLTLSVVAHADPVTLTSVAGTGVSATVTNYSLVGNQFSFTLNNTSTTPGAIGTITNIGFDLPGNRGGLTLTSASNPNYRLALNLGITAGAQTVTSSPTFDFALLNSNSNTFGGGMVANGIAPGDAATFTVTGDFSGLTAQQIADAIFARFQAVNGNQSDVTHVAAVPEPTTMVLLGTGLAGVAGAVRKRRKAVRKYPPHPVSKLNQTL